MKTDLFKRPLAILGAALLTGGALTLSATVAYAAPAVSVCSTGCDYVTIQEGVDAVDVGGTITVGAGTYAESVTINKSLSLVGPATQSPNTADPLVAANRGAEAIIAPAAGPNIHAINLTSAAIDVTISGFSVELPGTENTQRYLNAGTGADRHLTIANNLFTGVLEPSNGAFSVDGALGDASIVFVGNRVQDGGANNGLRIHNSTPAAEASVTITNNVWLDNKALAMNISAVSGASTTGVISANWIGNSTPGTGGVDNFGTRQGGMVLAGNFNGLQITNNDFINLEDAVISFWSGFSGTVAVTNNVIDGFSNMPGYAAIYVRPSAGTAVSDIEGVTFTNNAITNPTAGSRAILNQADTGTFDADDNWWGSTTPDFEALIAGDGTTLVASVLLADPTLAPTPGVVDTATKPVDTLAIGMGALALLLVMGLSMSLVVRNRPLHG